MFRICIARGESGNGYPWSLWAVSHRWERLPDGEKRAVIASNAQCLNVSILWSILDKDSIFLNKHIDDYLWERAT